MGIDPATLGKLFSDSIKMDGFELPLPGEHWVVLARGKLKGNHASGTAYFLGQIVHKRLVKALIAKTLRADLGEKVDPITVPKDRMLMFRAPECSASDTNSCWLMYGLSTVLWGEWGNSNAKMNPLTRAAAEYMGKRGIAYPDHVAVVSFVKRESAVMLDTSYYFDPGAADVTSQSASHFMEPESPGTQNMAFEGKYVEKLKRWGLSFWPRIESAFAYGK